MSVVAARPHSRYPLWPSRYPTVSRGVPQDSENRGALRLIPFLPAQAGYRSKRLFVLPHSLLGKTSWRSRLCRQRSKAALACGVRQGRRDSVRLR